MRLVEGEAFVSVVIPCLNEEEPIADAVREVLAQGVDEVIVVDNGSTDGTAARAAQAGARVVSEPVRGYGRACAAGAAAVSPQSEIVCFLAGDVREVLAQGVDEVIVVDNGSTDATAARAAEAGARVISEPVRGYGRACAAGAAAVSPQSEIVCFLDGDGSDVPAFMAAVVGPVAANRADFVMGSRLKGRREEGSMTPQQVLAGWLAGLLLRLTYGVQFSDMSPFRALRTERLRALGMREMTYGWNLEMQMRAAAAGWRILEVPVDHRCRQGGVSKVSGNLVAGVKAAWKIVTTFLRLAATLRRQPPRPLALRGEMRDKKV